MTLFITRLPGCRPFLRTDDARGKTPATRSRQHDRIARSFYPDPRVIPRGRNATSRSHALPCLCPDVYWIRSSVVRRARSPVKREARCSRPRSCSLSFHPSQSSDFTYLPRVSEDDVFTHRSPISAGAFSDAGSDEPKRFRETLQRKRAIVMPKGTIPDTDHRCSVSTQRSRACTRGVPLS